MSISIRTATMSVYPQAQTSAKTGQVYHKIEVMEPKEYNITFSPEGGKDPKQLEALWLSCSDDGTEVTINYSLKNSRFGQSLVVYDVIPVKVVKP